MDQNLLKRHIVEQLVVSLSSDSSDSSDDEEMESDEENYFLQSSKIVKIEMFVERTVICYSNETFKSHFRMSRATVYLLIGKKVYLKCGLFCQGIQYNYIVERLERSNLLAIHLSGREKVTSEKAFLLAMWYLSNTETFRQVSDRFNVSLSSAHRMLMKVLQFLLNLRTEFIKWPDERQYPSIAGGFKKRQGIENVIGAIDGCHIRIRRPRHHEDAYLNRNKYHSILLQGIVDHKKLFLDVFCGEAGSIHDARLLRKSQIYSKGVENPNFLRNYFLVGDSAYPSLRWLVPPFKNNGQLSQNQARFNYKHSSTRVVVEHTFGLLKGRFRRLHYLNNLDIKTSVRITMACCVLHNICQVYQDDTYIQPYDISNQICDEPETWSFYTTTCSRREEVFLQLFPQCNRVS